MKVNSLLTKLFLIGFILLSASWTSDDTEDFASNSSAISSSNNQQTAIEAKNGGKITSNQIRTRAISSSDIITYTGIPDRNAMVFKQKVLLHQSITGVTGVYFCDIYNLVGKLPYPSTGRYRSVIDNECGYYIPSIGYTSKKITRATTVAEDPLTGEMTLTTSFIYVRYDAVGREYNQWYPYNPNKAVLKYKWEH